MTDTPEEWLNYDDFAAGIGTNRLPRTAALAGQTFAITLANGRAVSLAFPSGSSVQVTEAGKTTTEWYEAVPVAADTFFLDLTFAATPTIAETLIVNTATRRVLSVRCTLRAVGQAPGEPRVAQDWVPGILDGGMPSGIIPHETRDLIGLRAFYDYSPNHLYEHIYLSSTRYGWQNLIGVQRGHGDTDLATTFKFADNQYVFGFREFIIPVASVFFYNWDVMRSTGKFLGETGDGKIQNNPAGAFIEKASMTYYPKGKEPV
jgi:hypothetical protein